MSGFAAKYAKAWIMSIAILAGLSVSGQVNKISGKITDHSSGEALPGASVIIANTDKGTTTGLNGEFELPGIKEDPVTLVISYIGYQPDTLIYSFKKNKKHHVHIKLKPVSTNLNEVRVTSQAEGQVKAMIEQKEAENIKNVVSSEQIEKFPDMNAAEAIQRIPGITLQRDQGEGRYVQLRGTPPELTNFNINGEQIPSPEGNVRYVGMDIISADQIEFIEITKVLTPDMDGDGIGGTVNIITKKAFGDKPEIKGTLAGGYNNLRQTGNYQVQFSYGQRYQKFGFQMNASYYVNNQGSDNMEFKYAKGPFWGSTSQGQDNYYVQYREFQLRHYDITRKRIGLSATLDYQLNENNSFYLRGMINNFTDDELRRRKIYDLDDAITEDYYLYGGIKHDLKQRTKIQNINTINLGGEHIFQGFSIDYEAAYAMASENEPNRMETQFENPGQAIVMKIDKSDPDWPRVEYPDSASAVYVYAYDKYDLDNLLFKESLTTDNNITGKVNFNVPYRFTDESQGFIQFGAKVRMKDKERNNTAIDYGAYFPNSQIYPGTGPDLSLASITDGFSDDNLLNHDYLIDYMPGAQEMRNFFEFYTQYFIIDRTETKMQTYGEDYKAGENIYAAYAMFRHDIRRLMILGGVRYERTDIDYEGRRIITKNGNYRDMDTLTDKRSHEFFLPQVQAKYMLNENTNIRAAVTYTYSRPNFEDVLPYREQDYDEVKYGNPDLKFPTSLNVDLLGEKYLRGQGLVSGGFFYKNIHDFIFYYKRFAHEGDPQNYGLVEITKAVNGNKAYVLGAEVLSQFKFNFLEGFWKNFGLYLNYTYTHSEAYINKRFPANYSDAVVIFGEDDLSLFSSDTEQERITLPGQAKHTANLAAFYESERFYAKISANYHDAFLYKLGADKDLDEYYDQAWHLDFTANYSVTEYMKVFVDVINLTNAPLKFYLGTKDRILKQEYYSWWGRIGIKLSF